MSEDIHAEARERYERAAAYIRDGLVAWPAGSPRPIYFSPLRNSPVIREGFEAERRAAEERDRREWTEGIRRRLGLLAEVHRCHVYDDDEGDGWAWFCRRWSCRESGHGYPSQPRAFGAAFAHARSFLPEPPEETPATGLAACRAAITAIMAPREVRWLTCEDWTTGPELGFSGAAKGSRA